MLQAAPRVVDLCRFLGAAAIFYYHVGIVVRCPLWRYGEYAVGLFIVLSGIAYVCFTRHQPATMRDFGRYFAARIWAIFPMFAAVNLALFAASYLYPSALGRPFSLRELALSVFGVSQYFGERYLSTVMWFVPFIVQAYLFFPLLDRAVRRVPPWVVILATFAVSGLAVWAAFAFFPARALEFCRNWSPIFRLPELACGVVFGRLIAHPTERPRCVAALLLYALIAGLLAYVVPADPRYFDDIVTSPWLGLVVGSILGLVALALSPLFRQPSRTKFLRWVGAASFPFYLIHGVGILFIFKRWGASPAIWAGYFLLCWGGALAAVLSEGWVRRRWLSAGHRKGV